MAGPNVPQALSRGRPPPTGDEETTAILRLGEYEDVPCISVSEANVLLGKLIQKRNEVDQETGRKPPPMPTSDVFTKTKDYLDVFARFRGEIAVQQVESVSAQLVNRGVMTGFERAQLGSYSHYVAAQLATMC